MKTAKAGSSGNFNYLFSYKETENAKAGFPEITTLLKGASFAKKNLSSILLHRLFLQPGTRFTEPARGGLQNQG